MGIKLLHRLKEVDLEHYAILEQMEQSDPRIGKLIDAYPYSSVRDIQNWSLQFQTLRTAVNTALPRESVFDINNVAEACIKIPAGRIEGMQIRPPYSPLWMEYTKQGKTSGALFTTAPYDGDIGVLGVFFLTSGSRGEILPLAVVAILLDQEGRVIRASQTMNPFATTEDMVPITGTPRHFYTALALLHCKNIEVLDHFPDESKNRKRRKKGKQPLVRYKTLRITESPFTKRYKQNSTREHGAATHTVRGHFRDYSKGKGLFGNPKLKGIYWTGPMLRGSGEHGVIVKDYKIK